MYSTITLLLIIRFYRPVKLFNGRFNQSAAVDAASVLVPATEASERDMYRPVKLLLITLWIYYSAFHLCHSNLTLDRSGSKNPLCLSR